MTARDELRQWVDDAETQIADHAAEGYAESADDLRKQVDLARRVLAEMDDARQVRHNAGEEWAKEYAEARLAESERDAALAKLDAVRAWAQNGEAYIRGGQRKELFRILDGSTP